MSENSAPPPGAGLATEAAAPKWRVIGPGLIVAATGVGAVDLVATLIAGSKYGYALLWCVVLGCVMKVVLVEGAGHAFDEPGILDRLIHATDRFAGKTA